MKHFNRKVLASAVLASIAGAAHAVYVDSNGLGQALIYPYYTVQNGHNTYVSVVNTTASVKVVKVRFREGKASKEVLDFNLYLSPNDVWTGAVIPSPSSDAGRLITTDTSCTNPAIPAAGVDFRNYLYVGDGGGDGLSRSREGYLEMIEMATLNGTSAAAATHTSSGVPSNCAALRGTAVTLTSINAPSGGLTGTGTLINVTNGQDSGYSAVGLAALGTAAQYVDIGNDSPNFNSTPLVLPTSTVVSNNAAYISTWTDPTYRRVDAVSSVLTHSAILNEYVLDTGTNSNTDWVMTFPTKHFYVTTSGYTAPFTSKFTSSGACEAIGFTFFNREEATQTPSEVDFSPSPGGPTPRSLCWESTVVSIRNGAAHMPAGSTSGVLGSANTTAVSITPTFQNGWAKIDLSGTGRVLTVATATVVNLGTGATVAQAAPTFSGLPVVGFMVRTFNNGTLGNFQANYGSAFEHKYQQTISPAAP